MLLALAAPGYYTGRQLTLLRGGMAMYALRGLIVLLAIGFAAGAMLPPAQAHGRCKTFEASHNGTDMFYDTGTEGTVQNKLLSYVDQWQKENGIKAVRIGKIKIKCGDWFVKYLLPHKNCKARARVCY